jgi:nucleotide-binding universal stress UspA family protein
MQNTPDLRILFPTSFSDACFRSSRAIAQLADICRIHLTIAHVAKPGDLNIRTRRELDSFMAEADHYENCRRVLVEADDAVDAIGDFCDRESFDLLIAPASDRLGLHRFFTSSFRARLLNRCKAPVWTVGNCLDRMAFKPTMQTVACVLDFDCPTDAHLRLAASLAWRTGAKIRIVTVIEPTDEGTLARAFRSRAPLMPEVAMEQIRSAFAGRACPEVDIAIGDASRELPRMLSRCDADLCFVGPGQALNGVWASRLASHLDRFPCPVVCVDGASADFEGWKFQSSAAPAEANSAVPFHDRALAS